MPEQHARVVPKRHGNGGRQRRRKMRAGKFLSEVGFSRYKKPRSRAGQNLAMQLTSKQQLFIDKVLEGKNIFLTGKAGTGKSFVVREAIAKLKEAGKKVVALAPTGIAANNIDGQTIHSLFNLNPFAVLTPEKCNYINNGKVQILKKADVIFIDEVSMLRPDILDAMQYTLQKNGLRGLKRKQLVFVGDLKQLPPPIDDNFRAVLYSIYKGELFTDSIMYPQLNVETVELDEVLRQSNEEFIEHLNIIREGQKSEYFRRFLSSQAKGIVLAPHNSTVQEYNIKGLQMQEGEELVFEATFDGQAKATDFQFEEQIRVKHGCKIMYLVNSQNNPLRNGTLGTFIAKEGQHFIRVHGVDYALEKTTTVKKQYVYNSVTDQLDLEEVGSMTQYPFKLAYALSIHKAQGLTFDEVTIDLTRPCFQRGQMYVALSRVRSPEGLSILI